MKDRVLVLGLGRSGKAAVGLLLSQDCEVLGADDRGHDLFAEPDITELKAKGLVLSEAPDLAGVKLVVLSPGVPPTHPLVQNAKQEGIPVIGEVELACRHLDQPILGVTGTNGKTTVTLMITHILQECGIGAQAVGNVGLPIAAQVDSLRRSGDVAVLELSSYQLETLSTPCLSSAVVLNITPDHLDRYETMEHYAAAKANIINCLRGGAFVYAETDVVSTYPHLYGSHRVRTFGLDSKAWLHLDADQIVIEEKIESLLPLSYRERGGHDVLNMLAAFALSRDMGVEADKFFRALESFKKPPHRMEFVARHQGVAYYNDSKGTNVAAVREAVRSLQSQVILIAGGQDKGSSFTPWQESFGGQVKEIVVIGQAADKIRREMIDCVPVTKASGLPEAVRIATERACDGESVVLSPGCASFDMFRDYAHRGDEFKRLVRELSEGKE